MNSSITLRNTTSELPRLMTYVEELGCEGVLPREYILGIQLALEEAVSNIMLYAYPEAEDSIITIGVEYDDSRVTFCIVDEGVAFDPTGLPDVDTSLSSTEREIGGLGVFIVRKIMDRVGYNRKDGKNILTLTKLINR